MLVKAGEVVDKTIAALRPLLDAGRHRWSTAATSTSATPSAAIDELSPTGIHFFGMGVSGGEEGARHGPSHDARAAIAPPTTTWRRSSTKIAAQVDDGPCVTYIGPGGAGHYVKMVHNGIEYGDMQLIAEAYDLLQLRRAACRTPSWPTRSTTWNRGELQSFLIEITRQDLPHQGSGDAAAISIDAIVDAAAQKGTGKWTVQDAAELGAPIPTIAASVEARVLSSDEAARAVAAKTLRGPLPRPRPAVEQEAARRRRARRALRRQGLQPTRRG